MAADCIAYERMVDHTHVNKTILELIVEKKMIYREQDY